MPHPSCPPFREIAPERVEEFDQLRERAKSWTPEQREYCRLVFQGMVLWLRDLGEQHRQNQKENIA